MNLDELTIGEAKELVNLLTPTTNVTRPIGAGALGKYVIVRTKNEGINAGYIKEMNQNGIILTEARRIWYHKPADKGMSWYEGVAISGLADGCKISHPVTMKIIMEDYSVTACTTKAKKSIEEYEGYAQN